MYAPICLFVYSRLMHTTKTVEALQRNKLANQSDLIIYSDYPRMPSDQESVAEVRKYIKTISGFKSITINYRNYNFGLANSIIDGVAEVLRNFERIIVVEDDLVTSPHFLQYMNDSLDYYADKERVISIHGYALPTKKPLPEAFFLKGADCWGWATWRRGWELFNPDGSQLLNQLTQKKMLHEFDYDGSFPFSRMLRNQINGKNNSWAIRWHASAFLADRLTLHPGRSLVSNIGHDASGTHCNKTNHYDVSISSTPIEFKEIVIENSIIAREMFIDFYKKNQQKLFAVALKKIQSLLIKLWKI